MPQDQFQPDRAKSEIRFGPDLGIYRQEMVRAIDPHRMPGMEEGGDIRFPDLRAEILQPRQHSGMAQIEA